MMRLFFRCANRKFAGRLFTYHTAEVMVGAEVMRRHREAYHFYKGSEWQ